MTGGMKNPNEFHYKEFPISFCVKASFSSLDLCQTEWAIWKSNTASTTPSGPRFKSVLFTLKATL